MDPHSDDDPTVIHTGGATQPAGPAVPAPPPGPAAARADTHALPIGTRLGEFELTHHIGEGGFGIVYLAYDHTLDRSVALKEYMPSSLATRIDEKQISVRSERYRETFEAGMKSFINEAKLLARFDHPSLVKVFRFWQENGTAYMAMPFYKGVNMRDTVRALPEPPGEEWLLELLAWLTEALAVIHAEQCYHRDIAPDNVMMLADTGRPLLLDFGAARRVIGDMTQALTVILKPGYAPVEQYAEAPNMKQGPWTDVYALAAVVYWTIAGKTPPPAVGRMLGDTCIPLVDLAEGRYSLPFLEAIDRALAVRPENRTPNIHVLREELGLPPAAVQGRGAGATDVPIGPDGLPAFPATRGRTQAAGANTQGRATTAPPFTGGGPATARTGGPTQARSGTTAPPQVVPPTRPKTQPRTLPPPAPPVGEPAPAAAPAGSRRLMLGLGAMAALLLGAGGWWVFHPRPAPEPPVVVVKDSRVPASVPAPASAPAPVVLPAALTNPPRSAADAFAQWNSARDPALRVALQAPASARVSGPEALQLSVTPGQPGYLYLVARRSDRNELVLLQPNTLAGRQPVDAGQPVTLGAAAWPPGTLAPGSWRLMALLARQPRDLSAAGWHEQGGVVTRSFDPPTPAAASTWWAAACPAGTPGCDQAFGTDEVQVELQPAAVAVPTPASAPGDGKHVRLPKTPEQNPPERRPDAKANAAECARLLQQMSLGDLSAELSARFKSLGCR